MSDGMISAVEAATNAIIGLIVSWTLTVFWLGFTPTQGAGITGVFFAASFIRAYIIRETFRRWVL